jgi:hypothetical protein
MAETPACALCGKDAIGFRSIGCSYLNVCMEPADSHILALRGPAITPPGKKRDRIPLPVMENAIVSSRRAA